MRTANLALLIAAGMLATVGASARQEAEHFNRALTIVHIDDVSYKGSPFLALTAKEQKRSAELSGTRADLVCRYLGYGDSFSAKFTWISEPVTTWYFETTSGSVALMAKPMKNHAVFTELACLRKEGKHRAPHAQTVENETQRPKAGLTSSAAAATSNEAGHKTRLAL